MIALQAWTAVMLLGAAGVDPVASAAPSGRALTLAECVSLASARNPDVLGAQEEVAAAKASRAAATALVGPRLRVEGNFLRWESEATVGFAPPPAPPVVVRDQITSMVSVSVIQPVTPLLAIYEGVRLRDLGVDIAEVRREATKRDTRFQVEESYFRLLQATRLAEVAASSVETVEAQVSRARKFEKQGVVGRNDVLRAEIALAAAKQRRIQADGAHSLASGRLAVLVGLPVATAIDPAWIPAGPAAPVNLTPDEAEQRAMRGRVELRELDARIGQAKAGRSVAWQRLAPQVNLVGTWQRQDGNAFAEKESAFVGATGTWDVWDWGASYFGGREAAARVRQAETLRAKVRDGLALETRAAHVAFTGALEAVRVAEAALAQAEENFRLETRRYEASASTTFDVLDAESLLTQARAQFQTALYDTHIASANLARAMGETPAASTTGEN